MAAPSICTSRVMAMDGSSGRRQARELSDDLLRCARSRLCVQLGDSRPESPIKSNVLICQTTYGSGSRPST